MAERRYSNEVMRLGKKEILRYSETAQRVLKVVTLALSHAGFVGFLFAGAGFPRTPRTRDL